MTLAVITILCSTTLNSIAYSINTDTMQNSISKEQKIVLEKINKKRIEQNISPLEFREDLNLIAKQKAEDLVNNNYFSHTSANYGSIFDMLRNNDIKYKIAGENLAGVSRINLAIDGWMASESHRDNILERKYKYTGIYVLESKTYGKIIVQVFLG